MNVMVFNEQVPRGRYSNWCEKRPLACADKEVQKKASQNLLRSDLTSIEKSLMYVHDLVDIKGIEFVLFSSAKFKNKVNLPEKITIVPCFLPDIEGKSWNDPLVRVSELMMTRARYIYDGWMPIEEWNIENVREGINRIEKVFSLFSLQERISNSWEPKYWINKTSPSSQKIEEDHIDEVKRLYEVINSWDATDSWAFLRSMGWLSQSLTLPPSPSRFLLCIVAMESLANYIEYSTNEDSVFINLKTTTRLDKEDRDKCIDKMLRQYCEEDKTKAILSSYNECIQPSIKKMLVSHLNNIFQKNKEPVKLLFNNKLEGKTLYDLRHRIAHGGLDSLSDYQKQMIQDRIWEIEDITRQYLVNVFYKITNQKPFSKEMIKSMMVPFTVAAKEEQWVGPKHMAFIYINQI